MFKSCRKYTSHAALFTSTLNYYGSDLGEVKGFHERFASQLTQWCAMWENNDVDESLDSTEGIYADMANNERGSRFTVIYKLFYIYADISVTSATAERSFSVLKREKTWLRTTMKNKRLSDLSLIEMHKDVVIPHERIVDKYINEGDFGAQAPDLPPSAFLNVADMDEAEDQSGEKDQCDSSEDGDQLDFSDTD